MSLTLEKIQADITPVVEIDTEAPAAYVCSSLNPVSRTVVLRDDDIPSTLDLDRNGNVIGIEVVWPTEFRIEKLIAESRADLVLPRFAIDRTRYVSARRSTSQLML
jgi:uncharacterized protein YuzE